MIAIACTYTCEPDIYGRGLNIGRLGGEICNPRSKYAVQYVNSTNVFEVTADAIFNNRTKFNDYIVVGNDIILGGNLLNSSGHPYCPKCCGKDKKNITKIVDKVIDEICFDDEFYCPNLQCSINQVSEFCWLFVCPLTQELISVLNQISY